MSVGKCGKPKRRRRGPKWATQTPEAKREQARKRFGPSGKPAAVVVRRMDSDPFVVEQGGSVFANRLAVLGYDSYGAYLASNHWADVRRRWAESLRLKCCAVCGYDRYELHHRSYRRLGREHLDDLTPLCRRCHEATHGLVGQRINGRRVSLLRASEVLASLPLSDRRRVEAIQRARAA